ncbi:alpha/beta fold hydrolase [Agrococcus sp. Ld7]|uniref:alpha/beta fold hydrolase n=1 Tax=Agrococcus sp. Ld7 TaxID=649148 RepID=UPI00386E2B07
MESRSDRAPAGRMTSQAVHRPNGVSIAVSQLESDGPVVVLLHGLAGSSRELVPTAQALKGYRVLLVDQRGHGSSTRRPDDLSRGAFVSDVVAVMEELVPGRRATLVGQSMGAHTAFLVAVARPDLVESLVMLEGHPAGSHDAVESSSLGRYFDSWPAPFANESAADAFLGDDAIADAWVADLEVTADGLHPRFDADIMERVIAAVHEPRWAEWECLKVPTLAVFGSDGMFSAAAKDELIRRRPETDRADLAGGSHEAHLNALGEWIGVLRHWLSHGPTASSSVRASGT